MKVELINRTSVTKNNIELVKYNVHYNTCIDVRIILIAILFCKEIEIEKGLTNIFNSVSILIFICFLYLTKMELSNFKHNIL